MDEKRAFRMHPRLLFDVIQRQAGTLGKAVLEGVMNAMDAGANQVQIVLTQQELEISDNGKGFRSRAEVEQFFEVFGQPHEESENKRFGCFRMGRGQLFAFGKNRWRTGEFLMLVDIRNEGLDYVLKDGMEPTAGCKISIELYNELSAYDIRGVIDEVKRAVKWVSVPVYLNGDLISRDPAREKWDIEDENGYYKFHEVGDLVVYNLGVIVRSYGPHHFGSGGEVVSKKQLRLNFARNDILSNCPEWKLIKKVINDSIDKAIRKKKYGLSDAARSRLAAQIVDGEISRKDAFELPVLTDVNNRHWSVRKMCSKASNFRSILTVACKGDRKGIKLMDHRLAFCMAEETLERFGLDSLEQLNELIETRMTDYWPYKVKSFGSLIIDLNDSYQILKPEELTPLEKAVLSCINRAQQFMIKTMSCTRATRHVLLGKAGCADGWTDGVNYIVINREFLRVAGTEFSGWIKIGQLLLHEYTHDEPDTGTHYHTDEFYEAYHDNHRALPEFVDRAIRYFPQCLSSVGRQLTRKQLIERDREKCRQEKASELTNRSQTDCST